MIVTIVGVLGGAALAALIFWWGLRSARSMMQPGFAQAPELSGRVQQIRALIRAANRGDSGAAMTAGSMLDDLESTYGTEVLSRACNPSKLRGLIAKVQSRGLPA